MAIRHFVVTGEHSSPKAFADYVYEQLSSGQDLVLTTEEQLDELSKKRANAPERTFTFRIRETHLDEEQVLDYLNVTDDQKNWIRIDVTDSVGFDLIE